MNFRKFKQKYLKSTEEVISMFLGLVIVLVVIALIFNYFQKNKGIVDIPGATDDISLNQESKLVDSSEYKVVKGDSLWKIAVRAYGDGYQWNKIWQENKSKLPNANGLEIGMVLNIPKLD
jgi:nucleoid-associated protein YgaU